MTTTTTAAQPGTVNQIANSYTMPGYTNAPSQDIGGFLQDYYASMVNPNTGVVNGYTGQMTAGVDPLQQGALEQVPNAVGSWGNLFSQGNGMLNQAAANTSATGVWDPSKMQQHLNPYLSGTLNQIQSLGNQNLFENVLPGVNSTFAGNGQFGSTRNADFTNRAMRDNQQAISNAQGTAANQAYGQAATDYLNWDKSSQTANSTLANIGNNLVSNGMTGATQNWNDLSNMFKLGEQNRAINQEGLTANYNNWQNTWNQPLDMASKMGGILSQLKSGITPDSIQGNTTTSDPNGDIYALIRDLLGGVTS
jgi:hypothetical protein